MLLPENSKKISCFANSAVHYTTAAWLGCSVLHGFCIRTYYVCLFFRPKARFSILRPHGLGHPLRQPRRLGPPFRQTSLYYGLKRSVPLQKPELRFVVVRWDPGGGPIGLPSVIIPRRYMSINAYPRISLRLLAWLLSALE